MWPCRPIAFRRLRLRRNASMKPSLHGHYQRARRGAAKYLRRIGRGEDSLERGARGHDPALAAELHGHRASGNGWRRLCNATATATAVSSAVPQTITVIRLFILFFIVPLGITSSNHPATSCHVKSISFNCQTYTVKFIWKGSPLFAT